MKPKQAMVVIDVQQALFDAVRPPYEADAVIQRINAMCARARAANAPVIWIQHENLTTLQRSTPGWQLHVALETAEQDHWVGKKTPDAFHHTQLDAWLQQHQIQEIVVAGYASEFCVDTSVRRAAALGYDVVIAADAHTTHDKAHASGAWIRQHHNTTLAAISSFGNRMTALPSSAVVFG